MNEPKSDNVLTYEQAIERLERIVEQIESGEVGLEEAIRQYEAGTKLIQRCRGILDSAERRIAELTPDAQGRLAAGEQDKGEGGGEDEGEGRGGSAAADGDDPAADAEDDDADDDEDPAF